MDTLKKIMAILVFIAAYFICAWIDTEPVNEELDIFAIDDETVEIVMPDGSIHIYDVPEHSTVADTVARVCYYEYDEGHYTKYTVVCTAYVDELGREYWH